MDTNHEKDNQTRKHAEADADPRVDLAVERTELAMERTQLAWARTVLTFITGGIAIDKGTEALHDARLFAGDALVKSGHVTGMFLSVTSTTLMVLTTIIYARRKAELNQMRGLKTKMPSPTTLLSIVVCILGSLAIYFMRIPWK